MIGKIEYRIGKLSDVLNKGSKVLLGIIVGLMFSIIFTNVILRYAFSSSLSWAAELTVFLMAWMTFMGSAIAVKQAAHINIDMFVNKLPAKASWTLVLISKLLMLTFIIFFTYYGFNFAIGSLGYESNVLRIPLIWPRISIAVTGIIMIIHMIHSIIKHFMEVRRG